MVAFSANSQNLLSNPGSNHGNKFEQLGPMLRSPNSYRTASGAPGPDYWQQKADYSIKAKLDDDRQILTGEETITYFNQSPDVLTYLWLQLDENEHDPKSDNNSFDQSKFAPVLSDRNIIDLKKTELEGLGDKIELVTDLKGTPLSYTINQTMMRIELPQPLKKGGVFPFKIKWHYQISNRNTIKGRGGYEYFPEDGNYLYTMTQWYPRMAVYSDFQGWQNKQFTGVGEFALTFGNFDVQITVPGDHVIGATGTCQNYAEVLSAAQFGRWQKAQSVKSPLEIVTLEEAKNSEKAHAKTHKIWHFKAENVRDFAWTSSRKFVWDAMPTYIAGKKIMCMSFYAKEAYNLWRRYSTKVVAHTLQSYSRHTFPYPYPVAQSVEATNGMEYPMICFNNGRTQKDGTYSAATKQGMISVIIHEVGHNFFPMIVNSDERQWTWMDEGLNSFCQFMAEQEFDNNYPSGRGPAYKITDYMRLPKDMLEPIMTNSENIIQFGANAYAKTATALNILRETVMGRELFDYSFKEYARRWAFKHPTPEDFFRTMEDASAVDLDWYWRGWFYSTDPVDISLDSVKTFVPSLNTQPKPVVINRTITNIKPYDDITKVHYRQEGWKFAVDQDTSLRDFYTSYKPYEITPTEKLSITQYADTLTQNEKIGLTGGDHYYELFLTNKGGLVMPVIIGWTYTDGTTEVERISSYIWRKNENHISKVFIKSKEVKEIKIDPLRETADIDESNNIWPTSQNIPSRFELYKAKIGARGQSNGPNPMQKALQNQ